MKKDVFLNFIKFLIENKINYSLLGNTASYPDFIGSDIDIAVSDQDFKMVEKWLAKFCKKNDYYLCNCLQHEIKGKYFVIGAINEEPNQTEFLAIDICSDYYRDGRLLIKWENIINNNRIIILSGLDINIKICNDDIAFLYYFLKKIEKLSINEEQLLYLESLWKASSRSIKPLIIEIFFKDDFQTIIDIFDNRKFEKINKVFLQKLKERLKNRYQISFTGMLNEILRVGKRIIRPTGLVIAFMGCDGSGKSTIINLLQGDMFPDEAFRKYTYFHLYPSNGTSNNGAVVNDPHEQEKRSAILSNFKLLYFLFKYTLGYWLITYPKKIKSNLVIFDRYYHDLLVDPIRYRHGGSSWLATVIGNIIPKPDIFLFVDAAPEIIYSRKQEVSPKEVIRQRNAYLELATNLEGFVVDNISTPAASVSYTKKAIIKYLAKRFLKRGYKCRTFAFAKEFKNS